MLDQARYLIYALTDPRTDAVRYVGKSSTGMRRPRSHRRTALRSVSPTYKDNWIRSLVAAGLNYGVRVLEALPHVAELPSRARRDALNEAEIRWIAHARAEGWPITNATNGGDGNPDWSPEARARMSAARKGKPFSETHLANLRANHVRGPLSDEHKAKIKAACNAPAAIAKMSAANIGRKRTPEHEAKLIAARAGRVVSAETRAKQSAARTGKKRAPETAEKIRAAKKGKPQPWQLAAYNQSHANREHLRRLHEAARGKSNVKVKGVPKSPEHRAKIAAALQGRVYSPETIERMRAAQQRRAAERRASVRVDGAE